MKRISLEVDLLIRLFGRFILSDCLQYDEDRTEDGAHLSASPCARIRMCVVRPSLSLLLFPPPSSLSFSVLHFISDRLSAMNLFTPSWEQLPPSRHASPFVTPRQGCLPSARLSFRPHVKTGVKRWIGCGREGREGESDDGGKAHLSLNVAWINRMMADSATH